MSRGLGVLRERRGRRSRSPARKGRREGAGQEGALPAQVEAVLFVAERPVTVSELARLLHVSPDAVEDAVGGWRGASPEGDWPCSATGTRCRW